VRLSTLQELFSLACPRLLTVSLVYMRGQAVDNL